MKVLLESSFPPTLTPSLQRPNWQFESFVGAGDSDARMIARAASERFAAVAFVGPQSLGRPDVLRAAIDNGMLIIATETTNPVLAVEYLAEALGRLRQSFGTGKAILVQAGAIVTFDLEELLAERLG